MTSRSGSVPSDADCRWRAFGDVGPVVAKVMNLEMLDPDRREDLGSSQREVSGGREHALGRQGTVSDDPDLGHGALCRSRNSTIAATPASVIRWLLFGRIASSPASSIR